MKLEKAAKSTGSINIFGEVNKRVEMGVSEEVFAIIAKLLTNLYNNPLEASIRETMSNAMDSSIRAKSTRPIEIELISDGSNYKSFSIRDYGEGMDMETLKTVFTQYGNSTKETDLDVIGAFGLGAKAPLAYNDNFTVISYKDGVEIELLLQMKESNNMARVVEYKETSEPNGTKVIIPIKHNYFSYILTIKELFSSYEKNITPIPVKWVNNDKEDGTRVFKGAPIQITEDISVNLNIRLSDGRIISNILSEYTNGSLEDYYDFSFMGWVYKNKSKRSFDDTLKVDLIPGLVNFSSSRDNITDDGKLELVRSKINEKIDEAFLLTIQKLINDGDLNYSELANSLSRVVFNEINNYNRENTEKLLALTIPTGETLEEYIREKSIFNLNLKKSRPNKAINTSLVLGPHYDKSTSYRELKAMEIKRALEDNEFIRSKCFDETVLKTGFHSTIIYGVSDSDILKIYNKSSRYMNTLDLSGSKRLYGEDISIQLTTDMKTSEEVNEYLGQLGLQDNDNIDVISLSEYNEACKVSRVNKSKQVDGGVIRYDMFTLTVGDDSVMASGKDYYYFEGVKSNTTDMINELSDDDYNVAIFFDTKRSVPKIQPLIYKDFISRGLEEFTGEVKVTLIPSSAITSKNIPLIGESFDSVIVSPYFTNFDDLLISVKAEAAKDKMTELFDSGVIKHYPFEDRKAGVHIIAPSMSSNQGRLFIEGLINNLMSTSREYFNNDTIKIDEDRKSIYLNNYYFKFSDENIEEEEISKLIKYSVAMKEDDSIGRVLDDCNEDTANNFTRKYMNEIKELLVETGYLELGK